MRISVSQPTALGRTQATPRASTMSRSSVKSASKAPSSAGKKTQEARTLGSLLDDAEKECLRKLCPTHHQAALDRSFRCFEEDYKTKYM